MKRLHFTVEGPTEEVFVKDVLVGHLASFEVFADARSVKSGRKHGLTIRGGLSNYQKVKDDLTRWLKEDSGEDVAFTTMFDYYQLPNDFPGYAASFSLPDPYEKVELCERAFANDIGDNRFIPYIQLHEFEALLFSDIDKLVLLFPDKTKEVGLLKEVLGAVGNPELIDNGFETAPSKRIINRIPQYDKTVVGPMVAQNIGLDTLRRLCRHFGEWIIKLEQL